MNSPLIALMTDFGTTDPYVGIMKGVISSIAPGVPLIDISHQIKPGDIQQGAYYLWQSSRDFPPGTIFLSVIDPGVGTDRKGIYLEGNQQIYIGPDNGLFSYLEYKNQFTAWELSNPVFQLRKPSSTFHGRDIFAPAAAHASRGISGHEFGNRLKNIQRLKKPLFRKSGSSLLGEVIHIDMFGNLITSLGLFLRSGEDLKLESWIDQEGFSIPSSTTLSIQVKEQSLNLVTTFAEIPAGLCAGLIGSTGLLEIAAKGKSAEVLLGIKRGEQVELNWV